MSAWHQTKDFNAQGVLDALTHQRTLGLRSSDRVLSKTVGALLVLNVCLRRRSSGIRFFLVTVRVVTAAILVECRVFNQNDIFVLP